MSDEKKISIRTDGIGLAVAALILGVCFMLGLKSFKNADRQVSVRGLCEKEVMADRAIYPIVFQEGGYELVQVAESIAAKNQIVIDFLKENGFTDEEITVAPLQVEDCSVKNAYSYSVSNSGNKRPINYVVKSVVTVYSKKVDKVQEMQGKQGQLLEKGIAVGAGNTWEYPVTYNFEGLNDIKPGMIAEANKNAKEAAEQFAKDSDSKLGKIKQAQQGLFTIEDRDRNTPQKKTVRVVTYVTYQLK